MKIKQIDVTEALELVKRGVKVLVMVPSDKPVVKQFERIPVGEVLDENCNYIFFVLEEVE